MSTATIDPRAEQREAARQFANEVRFEMASIRRTLSGLTRAEGCIYAAELLEEPPSEIVARMKLGYLLRSIHRVGRSRAEDIAHKADASIARRIGPMRLIGDAPALSLRQRAVIAAELRRLGGEVEDR